MCQWFCGLGELAWYVNGFGLKRAGLVCQWFCGLGELAWCVNGFVVEESWPGVSMVLWLRRAGLVCQWFCG